MNCGRLTQNGQKIADYLISKCIVYVSHAGTRAVSVYYKLHFKTATVDSNPQAEILTKMQGMW